MYPTNARLDGEGSLSRLNLEDQVLRAGRALSRNLLNLNATVGPVWRCRTNKPAFCERSRVVPATSSVFRTANCGGAAAWRNGGCAASSGNVRQTRRVSSLPSLCGNQLRWMNRWMPCGIAVPVVVGRPMRYEMAELRNCRNGIERNTVEDGLELHGEPAWRPFARRVWQAGFAEAFCQPFTVGIHQSGSCGFLRHLERSLYPKFGTGLSDQSSCRFLAVRRFRRRPRLQLTKSSVRSCQFSSIHIELCPTALSSSCSDKRLVAATLGSHLPAFDTRGIPLVSGRHFASAKRSQTPGPARAFNPPVGGPGDGDNDHYPLSSCTAQTRETRRCIYACKRDARSLDLYPCQSSPANVAARNVRFLRRASRHRDLMRHVSRATVRAAALEREEILPPCLPAFAVPGNMCGWIGYPPFATAAPSCTS